MPKSSERQELLKDVETALLLHTLLKKREARLEEDFFELAEFSDEEMLDNEDKKQQSQALAAYYAELDSSRYLHPRNRIARRPNHLDWLMNALDHRRFVQEVRMSKDAFFLVLDKVRGHAVFGHDGRHPQADPSLQLLVALEAFGMHGNGAAVGRIARNFGIAEGTVYNYVNRVIVALMSFEKQTVFWPDQVEQKQISQRIQAETGFPHCIGFIDGTLFPFESRTEINAEDYYSRKGRYGLSAMVVCDDRKKIRMALNGWPGCAHDARVFNNSPLSLAPTRYFHEHGYLLADSAYAPSEYIVPAYKKPTNSEMETSQKLFNIKHSNLRVRIEHCIVSQGLRMRINDEKSIRKASYWIRACMILHNLVLDDAVEELLQDTPMEDGEEDMFGEDRFFVSEEQGSS